MADYQMTRRKTIQRFWLLNLLVYAVPMLFRVVSHPLADELVPELRTLGQVRQFLAVIALASLVSLRSESHQWLQVIGCVNGSGQLTDDRGPEWRGQHLRQRCVGSGCHSLLHSGRPHLGRLPIGNFD